VRGPYRPPVRTMTILVGLIVLIPILGVLRIGSGRIYARRSEPA
jgi:hypothetical protein